MSVSIVRSNPSVKWQSQHAVDNNSAQREPGSHRRRTRSIRSPRLHDRIDHRYCAIGAITNIDAISLIVDIHDQPNQSHSTVIRSIMANASDQLDHQHGQRRSLAARLHPQAAWPRASLRPPRIATRRSRSYHARGSAGHLGSAGWHAPRRRPPARRTRVRSPRHGSSGRRPRSPAP